MKNFACRSIYLILLLLFSNSLIAQQKELGIWTSFTTAAGLAGNSIKEIIEAHDGAIWIATEGGGASRFQDGEWKTFNESHGLANSNVLSICESSDSTLWFGTGNGVSRYYKGIWKTYWTEDGLANNVVQSIFESSDGALWFATKDGVSYYYNNMWTTLRAKDGLASNNVYAICEANDGSMWFGTDKGVTQYNSGRWLTFRENFGLENNLVQSITISQNGTLWFGTYGGGVSKYANGTWTTLRATDGLANDAVSEIYVVNDGGIWIGTEGGISRYQNGKFDNYTTTDGLVHNWITSIIESSDGAMWFGTYGGVSRYEIGNSVAFFTGGSLVSSIIEDNKGYTWIGTVGRCHYGYYNGKTDTLFKNGELYSGISDIYESSDGALWFGTPDGAHRYKESGWTSFKEADGLVNNDIRVIYESSDRAMWFGTYSGASKYQNGKWTNFTIANGLSNNIVTDIIESSDGSIWFTTWGGGVNRYYNGIWTYLTKANGLVSNQVSSILESSNGTLWFATAYGVSRYRTGHWQTYKPSEGAEHSWMNSIIEASDGALWFGTVGGGAIRYFNDTWTSFTTADGLPDDLVSIILEASDGSFWLGTRRGFCKIKPDKKAPFTYITECPQGIIGSSTSLFMYNGKDYQTKQSDLLYSYAILNTSVLPEGSNWSSFSKDTYFESTPLPNGAYHFYVRAKDKWENIDPTPATRIFEIDITPPTVTIVSPKPNQIIASETAIVGSAYDTSPKKDFLRYTFSYAAGSDIDTISVWSNKRFSKMHRYEEIRNDTLAIWNAEGLPNGTYFLKLSANDNLNHESTDVIMVEVVNAFESVNSRNGGKIRTSSGNVELVIPPNAIPNDCQIAVRDFQTNQIISIDNPEVTFLKICFEIIPEDLQLLKPGTLSLLYPDSSISEKNEEKLAIYYSVDGKNEWQRLGGSIDLEKNKITTTIKQFGVFALYEDLTEGGKAGIFNVNSQPRIFSPQGGGYDSQTAISFDLGKASNVTIKIYNPAGRLVKILKENENMSHGNNVVYWDGKDEKGDFCMSGLYIVTIQAEEKMATKTVVVLNKY